MSIKIKLDIRKELNLELIEDGIKSYIYRFMAGIKFIDFNNPVMRDAIFDTGSPITIIPYSLWKNENVIFLNNKNKFLFGFGNNVIKGHLAKLKVVFADEKAISPVQTIKAYLIQDDSIPLIIGMEDVCNKIKIILDGKKQIYYLEF